eukprot:9167958-Lingulodinium_polyedra.AAC.1
MLTIDDHVGLAVVPSEAPPGTCQGGGARGQASFAAATAFYGQTPGLEEHPGKRVLGARSGT